MHITPHHRFVRPRQRPDEPEDDDDQEEEEEPVRPTRTRTRQPTPTADADDEDDEPVRPTRTSTTRSSTTRRATSTRRSSSTKARAASSTRAHSVSPTATPTLPASSGEPESSSTRAIIGVGASVAAVLVVAVGLWFLRKWFLKRHAAKHGAWRASLHDQLDGKRNTVVGASADARDKDAGSRRPLMSDEKGIDTPITPSMPSPPEPAGIPESLRPASVAPSLVVTTAATKSATPPATIGSPILVPVLNVTSPTTAAQSPVTATPTSPAAGTRREAAMVVRTFVPTLSDELPVTLGDVVFIIEAFTDGWASCSNSSGQNGVVPLECLQSMSRPQRNQAIGDQQQQDGANWRTSQRHSSLYGGVRTSGTY